MGDPTIDPLTGGKLPDPSSVTEIANLARKSSEPRTLCRTDPRKSRVAIEGRVHEYDEPRPLGAIKLLGVEDVAHVALSSDLAGNGAMVFVGARAVDVILDKNDRRECARMVIEMTDQWRTILNELDMGAGITKGPSDMVHWLRFNLPDCGEGILALETVLRQVKFTSGSTVDSETRHGEDSLGRSVSAAVDSTGRIEESVVLETQMFSTNGLQGIRAHVRIGVRVNHHESTITLRAYAGQVAKAEASASAAVVEMFMGLLKPTIETIVAGEYEEVML